jgi:hypothetical protein
MGSVDVIGGVRRPYFEQRLPIKEIFRTLSVSRATVRKIIRSHKTEFKYERGVQPGPKLGEWVDNLTEILKKKGKLPGGSAERRKVCSRDCVGAVITAPMTVCIGSPRPGARWPRGIHAMINTGRKIRIHIGANKSILSATERDDDGHSRQA